MNFNLFIWFTTFHLYIFSNILGIVNNAATKDYAKKTEFPMKKII